MTLDGIEKMLADKYYISKSGKMNSNHAAKYKVSFCRYADDFIVTAKTEEIAKEDILINLISGLSKNIGILLGEGTGYFLREIND